MNKTKITALKQEGMFMIPTSQTNTSEQNYVPISVKQSDLYMSPTGQIFSSSSSSSSSSVFPVEMFPHKEEMEKTVFGNVRRTRSLIPHSIKCQIIQLAQDNPRITQGEIAQMFGIDRTTVSKILKRRHKFLEESQSSIESCSLPKSSKTDSLVSDALCKYLNMWYLEAVKKNDRVTQTTLKEVAQTMAKSYGVFDLSFVNNWLDEFCASHNIKESDIEDLVKREDASSSDEVILIEPPIYPQMSDLRETSPKLINPSKSKLGTRIQHTATYQNASMPRQPSSASTTVTSSVSRQGTGNKIPRVQTETADTTRDDLLDVKKEIDELDTSEAIRREMGNLEKFREQQKMIEEANKQRKALLSKTLSERQKKAHEEARKLAHIQREVMVLDNLLTADVNVIRSRIEVASRDFLDAQKRYEKAEKEFIDAKVDLQKKSELKEHLTEHLYTIIHQNELRKANKLSELMKELEMEQTVESQVIPTLPPLSSFNTMSSVDTFHSPKSPEQTTHAATQDKTESTESSENTQATCLAANNICHTELKNNCNGVKQGENMKQCDVGNSQNVKLEETNQQSLNKMPGELSENINSGNIPQVSERLQCDTLVVNLTEEKEQNTDTLNSAEENNSDRSCTGNESQTSNLVGNSNSPGNIISISPLASDIESIVESSTDNPKELPSGWSLDVVQKE